MQHAKPLPDYLVARYRAWRATAAPEDVARAMPRLADRARARRR